MEFHSCPRPGASESYSSLIASVGLPLSSIRSLLVIDVTDGGLGKQSVKSTGGAAGPFRGLHNLTRLTIRNAAMRRVEENLLEGLSNLTVLELSDNGIEEVPKDLLSFTPELKSLDLGWNALTEIPMSLFSRSGNMEKLKLHGNGIRSLAKDIFKVRAVLLSCLCQHMRQSKKC